MESHAPKLILIPTDFSAPSAQALRYGAAIAERFSAHLLVIYADTFTPPVDLTMSAAGTFDMPKREELVAAVLAQLRAFVKDNIPATVACEVRVVMAAPVHAIVEQAKDSGANLIVMGTHGRTGLRRLLVGSVTEAVMRLAPVPVMSVHEDACAATAPQWMVGCVVPGRESRAALQYATLLGARDACFVLFGTTDVADRPFTIDDLKLLEVCTPAEIAGRAAFKAVDATQPADVLAAAQAEHADLIVLGIGGERGFSDALRGTLAERIVQQSTCPVLTVNRFAAARTPEVEVDVDARESAITV